MTPGHRAEGPGRPGGRSSSSWVDRLSAWASAATPVLPCRAVRAVSQDHQVGLTYENHMRSAPPWLPVATVRLLASPQALAGLLGHVSDGPEKTGHPYRLGTPRSSSPLQHFAVCCWSRRPSCRLQKAPASAGLAHQQMPPPNTTPGP